MKVLLDTHAVVWFLTDQSQLSGEAKSIFLDTKNKLSVSPISFWELAIKSSIGKISLKKNWHSAFKAELDQNAIQWLSITPEHCHQVENLPFHHRDPFDRMLVAQALVDEMRILTHDSRMPSYGVECLW